MYRNTQHNIISHLTRLVIASCMLAACVDEDELLSPWPVWQQGLLVQPAIVGSNMTTRAYDYYDNNTYSINGNVPADDELKENDLGTRLDVFIAGQGSDHFWMQYHLVKGQETVQNVTANVLDQTADLLAKSWSDVEDLNHNRLVNGHDYDVYVAVNNPETNGNIASKAALMALTYENVKVHKLYGTETTGSYDASRRMLMEGHVVWTCTNEPLQRIEVPLKRAEAKVVVTVDISPAFLAQLRAETGLDTPIGTPTATAPFNGTPAWKYVNWCIDTKVFADGNDITPDLLTDPEREDMTENTLLNQQPYYYYNGKEKDEQGTLIDNTTTEVYFTDNIDDTDEYGRRYTQLYPVDASVSAPYDGRSVQRTADAVPRARLITYTYASSWGDEAQEKAPYILVSYPFYRKKAGVTEVHSSDDLVTTYNYYRIPVCDERTNTELKRNYIYKVNAIISGAGSTSFTQNETPVKLRYEVLPWTQDASEEVKVKGEQFHYFYVTPTTYTLRGDDTQSVNLNYYAATGDVVKFRNLQVYYYNSSGTRVDIYGGTADERNAVFTTKSLTGNNNAGKNYSVTINSDGTISVSSDALANRAVKYISFTAYMTYTDENNVTQTLEQDIIIKHFPLDNIQNVEGWYSTKTRTNTMTAYEIVYSQTSPGAGWTRGVQEDRDQRNKPDGEGWFSNDYEGSILDYDYTTGSGWNRRYWKYRWSRIPWYRETTQTYSFVDWQETPTGFVIGRDDCMQTKVYQNGRIYFIVDSDITNLASNTIGIDKLTREQNYYANYKIDGYWYYHQHQRINRRTTNYGEYPNPYSNNRWALNSAGWDYYGTYYSDPSYYEEGTLDYFGYLDSKRTNLSGYTNNHMYIVQVSSTSDSYILGRPIIDGTTHLSNDHVVSPAFMIASQLGAMSTVGGMNAAKAAQHCSDYVEVATDGTRYTGWRLPTKEEVSVILAYQYDPKTEESMAEVLAAKYYYTLDGTTAENTYENRTGSDGTFARCVRDLSPEEIAAINSKQ